MVVEKFCKVQVHVEMFSKVLVYRFDFYPADYTRT